MIQPNDLLQLADALARSNEEVYLRESIIASYYAAFHECCLLAECLANHAGMGERSGSHQEIIRKLSKYPANNSEELPEDIVRKIRSIGFQLNECRNQRNIASYHLNADITQGTQQNHDTLIKKLLATLTQLQATLP